jgi:hypothetical protein
MSAADGATDDDSMTIAAADPPMHAERRRDRRQAARGPVRALQYNAPGIAPPHHGDIVMTDPSPSPSALWKQASDQVKDRVTHMSLWLTMEQAVGLVIEDDTLILALPSRSINRASYLLSPEHRNAIEKALSRSAGRAMAFRVIEGESVADWEIVKKREDRVRAMREAAYDRDDRKVERAQSWDEVVEGAARAWSACNLRALPQTKARYVRAMANVIVEAIERLCPSGPDEASERLIAKVIDRVATNADVAPTVVALEIERLQSSDTPR